MILFNHTFFKLFLNQLTGWIWSDLPHETEIHDQELVRIIICLSFSWSFDRARKKHRRATGHKEITDVFSIMLKKAGQVS